MRDAGCQFCLEFDFELEAIYFSLGAEGPRDRAVHRSEHFRVIPPLGQFVEGAVMLVSEEHVPSCGDLAPPVADHLEGLMRVASNVLSRTYCRPLFFEHGPRAAATKGACCVDHAHVHAFPVDVDVHSFLAARFPHRSIERLEELRAVRPNGYLFLEQHGQRYVYEVDPVPSQLIRQVIARELGVPNRWHWRDYLGLNELKRTHTRLKEADWL